MNIIVMKMKVYVTFGAVVAKMCWLSKIDSLYYCVEMVRSLAEVCFSVDRYMRIFFEGRHI